MAVRTRPLLPVERPPEPPRPSRGGSLFVIWAIALGVLIIDQNVLLPLFERFNFGAPIYFLSFVAALIFIALTMYGFAVILRWALKRIFWRVGSRLFLSYVLIGVFPFFLFAILLLAVVYMIAGVMTQAALHGERQASLGQLESAALEYGMTGKRPADALPSLEIYDSAAPSGKQMPAWLHGASFSGLLWRESGPVLVASHLFARDGQPSRNVAFVQPVDRPFAEQVEEKSGMTVRMLTETDSEGEPRTSRRMRMRTSTGRNINMKIDDKKIDDREWKELAFNALGRKIIWVDSTELGDWNSGASTSNHNLVSLIINPVPNLFHFYFGSGGSRVLDGILKFIGGLTVLLLCIYMFAGLFAAVLIYSISRAVNRIEKGTKAVERGDFSYRISMKPRNQLGEMAQSFDRMTESIATLLTNVAEKERLQSEIEIAASIQRNLLPKEGPHFRGVSFSAHFEPTASIGGDYYDVFNIDKSRLAVAIGDVSGHGLSTGLVMAMVKAAITTLVEEGTEETSLFHRLNELVYRSTERRAFMTLAFTIFDLEHGTIRHTNAGHLYPYLLRTGSAPISIEVPSLPLGVRSEITTHTEELALEEGDAVVYLSDGIVEAQNEHGDPFGFDSLEALLATTPDRSPSAIRDAILAAVARHSGTRPADDDRTVMVLRFENMATSWGPAAEPALAEATA